MEKKTAELLEDDAFGVPILIFRALGLYHFEFFLVCIVHQGWSPSATVSSGVVVSQ